MCCCLLLLPAAAACFIRCSCSCCMSRACTHARVWGAPAHLGGVLRIQQQQLADDGVRAEVVHLLGLWQD